MLDTTPGLTAPKIFLSEYEKKCLYLLAEGKKPSEIGTILTIAEPEAEDFLVSAETKLGARNRLHAVSVALSLGLLEETNQQPD